MHESILARKTLARLLTIYLLATRAIWQGIVLVLCGFIIISSIDNVVRPILVGHNARMPDYVVLIATLRASS